MVTGLQFGLAAIIGWALILVFRGPPPRGFPIGRALLFGAIAPGGAITLSAAAMTLTDIVSVTVIWGLAPLLIPLAGRLFLGERLQPLAYAGATGGFILVSWLVTHRQMTGEGDLYGNILVVAGILCATASQILGRSINMGGGFPYPYVAMAQIAGAAMVAVTVACIASIVTGRLGIPAPEPFDFWLLGYLVVFCSIVTFLSYNFALRHLPVAFVSLYFTLIPAIGTILGTLVLDTEVSFSEGLIVAGIVACVALPSVARIHRSKLS